MFRSSNLIRWMRQIRLLKDFTEDVNWKLWGNRVSQQIMFVGFDRVAFLAFAEHVLYACWKLRNRFILCSKNLEKIKLRREGRQVGGWHSPSDCNDGLTCCSASFVRPCGSGICFCLIRSKIDLVTRV